MSRYIDADLLLEKLKSTPRYFNVKFDIENAPTADVKPIVRGEWICANESCAICNKCNRLNQMYGDFCKYCGADMRKKSESNEQ